MPLLPIDLQTLFTQLNQVGKEQAVQKEAAAHAQALQGSQLARKTEIRDNAVNETQGQSQGPEQVKPRLRKNKEHGRKPSGGEEEKHPSGKSPREQFSDPALGRNVDLSG